MGWKGWAGWLVYGLETELAVVGERDKHSKPLYLRDNLPKLHHWFMLQNWQKTSPNCPSIIKNQRSGSCK